MKKATLLILTLLLCSSIFISCNKKEEAETQESDTESEAADECALELRKEIATNSYTVTGIGKSTDTELVIPDSYKDLPITKIDDKAFWGCSQITSVKIGKNVESIGANAFAECPTLKRAELPDAVTKIGERAFFSCPSLESVTFGAQIRRIEASAFEKCKALKSVALPESLSLLGNSAFFECESLESVTVGNKLSEIGISAFDKTALLKNKDKWDSGVLYLGKALIKVDTEKTDELIIKEGTTLIAPFAAVDTKFSALTIPSSVEKIGNSAFANSDGITAVTIPDSVKTIDASAFASCSALKTVTLPDSIRNFGTHVFVHCTALTSANIPKAVTEIPQHTFNGCSSLENIEMHSGIRTIGAYAFSRCAFTQVTLPDSVKTLETHAFHSNYSLISINIPKNVSKIGTYCFDHCYKLIDVKNASEIKITVGTTENGHVGRFLKELNVEEGKIAKEGDFLFYTFEGVNYLMSYLGESESVTLPDSYKGEAYEMYRDTFSSSQTLTQITVPNGIKKIPTNAFKECKNLTEITLPNTVTTIDANAFNACTALVKVNFNGTKAEFDAIKINSTNSLLINAEIITK